MSCRSFFPIRFSLSPDNFGRHQRTWGVDLEGSFFMQSTSSLEAPLAPATKTLEELDSAVIRFCGDSGDGMQLVGTQFTNVSAAFGNDVSTLPDFPAEIRAPAGTLPGVSGFQLHFSSHDIFTPGDLVDTLVVMNPAALKTNIADLRRGGTLILNQDEFDTSNLEKAGYKENPLNDAGLASRYDLHKVPMTRMTRDAVEGLGLTTKEAGRCKNFFALGLVYWLYERDSAPTEKWIADKFKKNVNIGEANLRALRGGYNYGYSVESFPKHYRVPKAKLPPGKYRKITGNEATALGLVTGAKRAGKRPLLRRLSHHPRQRHPPRTFDDEKLRRADLSGRRRNRRHGVRLRGRLCR